MIESMADFMNMTKPGNYIYPQAVRRALKLDNVAAHNAMKPYIQSGDAVELLEICCPHCSHGTGQTYCSLQQIPAEIYCEHCDEPVREVLKHVSTIYQKA